MSRSLKQLAYGALYLAAVAGAAYAFVFVFTPAAAPGCVANCPSAAPALVRIGAPTILKTSDDGHLAVLAEVKNPSADYGATGFSYGFTLLDARGGIAAAVPPATSDILPGEDKYLVGVYSEASGTIADISAAVLNLGAPDWRPAAAFNAAPLSLAAGPDITVATSGIEITGAVRNGSGVTVAGVRALAIISDKYHDPLFAGTTVLPALPAFGVADFSVALPYDPVFAARVDRGLTKVYLYQ